MSQSAVFMLPEKVSFQLSSAQSIGDVWIAQLDWKRVPQARSRGCKSSVAITTECSRHQASRNVCVSVDNEREPNENDRDTVWVVESSGPKKPCVRWGIGYPHVVRPVDKHCKT